MKKIIALLMTFGFLQNAAGQNLPAYVPANGLQGFWPFDGNANDISGNGNHGTPFGVLPTFDRFNIAGMAYSFNGSSDFISTNMNGILGNASRAVSFWARTTQSVNVMSCVAWGDEQYFPNNGVRFECGFNPFTGGPAIIGSDCSITYSGSISTFDNSWHHYVYQFNGGNLNQVEVYQDGVLLTQTLNTFYPNTYLNTSNLWKVHFGKIPFSLPHYFEGAMDEVGIWNRVLTSCEIWELYNSSKFTVNATANPPAICSGQTVVISASGANTYSWSTGSNASQITVTPSVNTTYTVNGAENTHQCSGIKIINVTVTPMPNTLATSDHSVLCRGMFANLFGTGASSYTWMPGNITGSNIAVAPAANTVYTLTGANGTCVTTSTIMLQLTECTGIEAWNMETQVSLKPNPAKNHLMIVSLTSIDKIEITDLSGKTLKHEEIKKQNSVLVPVEHLTEGIYFIRIFSGSDIIHKKFIKE